MTMIREAQLLLYKGRPARVKKIHGDDRLEIETLAGELKKVRPKDVVALHPGWVRTDMGGPNGLIDTQTSAHGMRQVLEHIGPADSGRFINYDGTSIAW